MNVIMFSNDAFMLLNDQDFNKSISSGKKKGIKKKREKN